MLNKNTVFETVQREIKQKSFILETTFSDLNSAVKDDSKSTAGDKHETGRAMVHLEQEKLAQQLNSLNSYKETLAKINPSEKHHKIQFGSLVKTNKGYFFFSIGLGKIIVENQNVFCLNITTPLGNVLLNKKKGDKVEFNGTIEVLDLN